MTNAPDNRAPTRGLGLLAGILLSIGTVTRLAPLLDQGGRLLRQFPTEDGYFMLTIARNLALGKGMTVADGTMLTNGTQPLATFLWAAIFGVVSGDRVAGVRGVLLLEFLIAVATAATLYFVGTRLLRRFSIGERAALLACSVWYASPVVLPHTMNCLETGLYGLLVAFSSALFLQRRGQLKWSIRRCANFGAVLGLTFWARNDAVFLIAFMCLTHWWTGPNASAQQRRRSLFEAIVFGATSVVVAIPWLIYNYLGFGSIVPISGQAESLGADFAGNLHLVPLVMFEYANLVVPVPQAMEESPWVIAITTLLCTGILVPVLYRAWRHLDSRARTFLLMSLGYGLAIASYYGLLFGAGWFVNRYLYPLSILFTLLWGGVFAGLWSAWPATRVRTVAGWLLALVLVGIVGALNVRIYLQGDEHAHFQAVGWVQRNVEPTTWVGAVQTGTLGFFHDRTINFDGKVNPEALQARKQDTQQQYVVDSPARYIVDWSGMAEWANHPVTGAYFELVLHDPEANLAVLRRTDESG